MNNCLFDGLLGNVIPDAVLAKLPDGTNYSYQDLLTMSAQMANTFVALGLKQGDRVAVQAPKSLEMIAVYIACARAGMIFLPLNTAYTGKEIEYFIEDAGASLFVCDSDKLSELGPIAKKHGAKVETLSAMRDNMPNQGSLAQKADRQSNEFENVACDGDTLAAILYTSGTTGRSKGAMLTHDNLLSNASVLVDYWHFTKDDVLLHALPIFHTHGLFVATNITLKAGSSMIFMPGFDLEKVLAHLGSATTMMGVPTFYTRLLGSERFTKEIADHMRLFISGSAPLLAETHVEFEERTGKRILERYGMTETNMTASNPYDGTRKAGTVGFPLPGVSVRICEADTGNQLPDGEIGVLEVKGPNVFAGYWNMPEKTKEEFRDDGYFISGDLSLIDENGYVQIVGRSKDLIISGGYNIYPKEIELLLDEQDGVLESAVIGVPHPDFGEGVVGVVVASKDGLDADELIASLSDQVARFKQPKKIFIVDELPRNTMGKVQKNILREKHASLFQ
jgi:malonyl-CoA/methylmalonyl-CoA synthetase